MNQSKWPQYGRIDGPIVMIGFGSIGRGTLPLIDRHFSFDRNRLIVIDPDDRNRALAESYGARFIHQALTSENYRQILTPLFTEGGGQGFCVNLSVEVSSLDVMALCQETRTLYLDTVIEPWPGFYYDPSLSVHTRSNYAMREDMLALGRRFKGGTTSISCCGANPGMVSWFVKQALLDIAAAIGQPTDAPTDRAGWARLMQRVGVKGIHIAERDTQITDRVRPLGEFWNTWSFDGFVSEGLQPAELGWGTHERWRPANAASHRRGCKAAILLKQPGADTRVRSWCPTDGPQFGYLVTHNEAISISDYFTVGKGSKPEYRPTCHYAYHPSDAAVLSLHEMFGRGGHPQAKHHVLDEKEITAGGDDLGVLLYGHPRNAYWYGSRLSCAQARALAPHQNATGLQVTSAVLAGMVWALENPRAGVVEADDMDFRRCLEVQRPYLGSVEGHFTDWTPLTDRVSLFPEDLDTDDPWQFRNILVR